MRLLDKKESDLLWKRLKEKWGIQPYYYWYPLTDVDYDDTLAIALDAEKFAEEFGQDRLRVILASRGTKKILKLSENGYGEQDSEIDIDEFEAEYDGAEGFWCTEELDWIIYASHEVSITFAGSWLVEQIKSQYGNWQNRLWFNMKWV